MITVGLGTWIRRRGWGSQRNSFKGDFGAVLGFAFWKCVGVFPKLPSGCALPHCRAKQRKGGKSSFNFLPATSASAHPWEAGRGLGDGCAQPVGMAAPTPTRGRVLAPDAGHGKPLPCTPAPANGAWKGPTAAPGCSEIPRPNRVAARARIPVAELAPCSGPRTPPQRRRPSPPAPQSPNPERFGGPRGGAAAAKRGRRAPRLTCALDPGAARRGAGRRRAGPADSNFVALGTAQSSLPRGAGGAARAVTQQLARWRAGPCSRPRPRLCAPSAAEERGLRSAFVPPGEARSSLVVSALKMCWMREDGVGVQGPRTGVPRNTKDGKGGRESFSVWC